MSPVDPVKLKAIKPYLIDQDRACVKCGYNLVGLMSDGVCPECGRKINIRNRDLPRYADNLVNAPMAWLGLLATGSLVLFLASLGLFASLAAGAWLSTRGVAVAPLVAAGFGAVWFVGAWIVTRPRPMTKATTVSPTKEWFVLRWTSRATQAFWVITPLLLAGYAHKGVPELAWAAVPSFVIAVLGLIPFCVIVSNIAYWGSDTGLAGHLRAAAWSVGFGATLIVLHVINIFTHSVIMGGFWASLIAGFLILFVVLPFFYMIFCCFQLQGMTRWALLNHATADAKDERLRQRAAAAAAGPIPFSPPLVENVDVSAFNLGDSEVDVTANQESLRRQGHVVQPKAHDTTPLPVENKTPKRGRPKS